MQKLLTCFQQNVSIYAIFNDKNFDDTLTKDIVSFEQLGPDCKQSWQPFLEKVAIHIQCS